MAGSDYSGNFIAVQEKRSHVIMGCKFVLMRITTADRTGLKPMRMHWAPRHGIWVDCSSLPDTPCT